MRLLAGHHQRRAGDPLSSLEYETRQPPRTAVISADAGRFSAPSRRRDRPHPGSGRADERASWIFFRKF